jgi:deazaflavin-dependent oxidoreductase (nitroreductase family)
MTETEVVDSPRGWVNRHIKEYVASGGAKGHRWKGAPTLLLTTVGRVSGLRRRTALIYGQDGDNYVVVASSGGQAQHPKWYTNLEAEPHVEVQVGPEVFPAVARTAHAEERERLWPLMADIWPAYRDYQNKTTREIPVVVLERAV